MVHRSGVARSRDHLFILRQSVQHTLTSLEKAVAEFEAAQALEQEPTT
jgi:hypothetical protein